MTNEREAFEAWALHPLRHGNYQLKRDAEFGLYESKTEGAFEIWQASRKVACDQVVAHFEGYTNPVAGHILAEQVKDILK